ncbi:hypothetical protein [Gallaecimonas xiamenensis]|uniref:hypothetical protein n=1 Tax=Gallaecimonas xiamenensis TaxID=1207039 RepID=UPI0012E993E9|nr:hypothetical protein [Gallaecimonas xiamenensis]
MNAEKMFMESDTRLGFFLLERNTFSSDTLGSIYFAFESFFIKDSIPGFYFITSEDNSYYISIITRYRRSAKVFNKNASIEPSPSFIDVFLQSIMRGNIVLPSHIKSSMIKIKNSEDLKKFQMVNDEIVPINLGKIVNAPEQLKGITESLINCINNRVKHNGTVHSFECSTTISYQFWLGRLLEIEKHIQKDIGSEYKDW